MITLLKQCKEGTIHLVKIPSRYRTKVIKTAKRALTEAGKILMYHETAEIVIFSSDPGFVIPELGMEAHALIQGDIVVNMDFTRPDIKKVIQNELSPALYHELSHVVRASIQKTPYGTLGESLVTEGIASYIEKKVFLKRVPYIKPIKNEKSYLTRMQEDLNKKDYNHSEWFYGAGKLPRWIGYRFGYLMVDFFMKHQKEITLAQLVRINSRTILQQAASTF